MTAPAPAAGSVTPAHLGFLAIFNPSLGDSDETLDDQIVYYASVTTQNEQRRRKRRAKSGRPTEGLSQEERHERLRQIGLAQGMASFSRGFADGAAVDTVDTDKTRVVLHELEPGWWILASIDLTKIPLPPRLPTKTGEAQEDRFEYSTREMKPASLLLNDLLRAHNIFLMHHDSSLSALFVRSRRSKFVAVLSRYWDLYLSTWNVMLHGNPVRDSYGGINIAASGELGVGVGEEDRGSSEREVLEGLVGRVEGLVDLAVSRFGEYDQEKDANQEAPNIWLGTGQEPGPEDGAIFLGTGALSRKSLRDITHWMEDLYTWGEHAYGLIESPTSTRRRRKSKVTHLHDQSRVASDASAQGHQTTQAGTEGAEAAAGGASKPEGDDEGKMDKMLSYMKLGYGTYWSLPGQGGSSESPGPQSSTPDAGADTSQPDRPKLTARQSSFDEAGHFLIGLKGEIEEATSDHDETTGPEEEESHNSRTVLRTINVEVENESGGQPEAMIVRDFQHPASVHTQSQVVGNMVPGYNSHDLNKARKCRAVVYVNRPFIFTFLFELRTDSLNWESLYRSLHYQLAPLKKQLLASTTYRPERPSAGISGSNIYDLVWDSKLLTVHSTIPNIPETYEPQDSWSRADALSTHLHLLNIHSTTRADVGHFERTQKTSRGWWIVWTRLLEDQADTNASLSTIREAMSEARLSEEEEAEQDQRQVGKEIFLIRRASDHVGFRSESGGGSEGAGRLAQGIGVDTRRYVEELLSLL